MGSVVKRELSTLQPLQLQAVPQLPTVVSSMITPTLRRAASSVGTRRKVQGWAIPAPSGEFQWVMLTPEHPARLPEASSSLPCSLIPPFAHHAPSLFLSLELIPNKQILPQSPSQRLLLGNLTRNPMTSRNIYHGRMRTIRESLPEDMELNLRSKNG